MSTIQIKRARREWLAFSLVVAWAYAHATVIDPLEWVLTASELAEKNFRIDVFEGLECGEASAIYVTVPDVFNAASYSSTLLILGEMSKPLLSAALVKVSVDETLNGEYPFSGASFCLDRGLMDTASLHVAYRKGEHITDVVVLQVSLAAVE